MSQNLNITDDWDLADGPKLDFNDTSPKMQSRMRQTLNGLNHEAQLICNEIIGKTALKQQIGADILLHAWILNNPHCASHRLGPKLAMILLYLIPIQNYIDKNTPMNHVNQFAGYAQQMAASAYNQAYNAQLQNAQSNAGNQKSIFGPILQGGFFTK